MRAEKLIIDKYGPGNFLKLIKGVEQLYLVSQIQRTRLKNRDLRNVRFLCGDGCGYSQSGNDILLNLTDGKNNPALTDPEGFTAQLLKGQWDFFLDPERSKLLKPNVSEHKKSVSKKMSITCFNLSEMLREGIITQDAHSPALISIEIDTNVLTLGENIFTQKYSESALILFKHVHGQSVFGNKGIGALLQQKKKKTTGIFMLHPDYVQQRLKDYNEGTTLWRICSLAQLNNNSNVHLVDRVVIDPNMFVYGKLL